MFGVPQSIGIWEIKPEMRCSLSEYEDAHLSCDTTSIDDNDRQGVKATDGNDSSQQLLVRRRNKNG